MTVDYAMILNDVNKKYFVTWDKNCIKSSIASMCSKCIEKRLEGTLYDCPSSRQGSGAEPEQGNCCVWSTCIYLCMKVSAQEPGYVCGHARKCLHL